MAAIIRTTPDRSRARQQALGGIARNGSRRDGRAAFARARGSLGFLALVLWLVTAAVGARAFAAAPALDAANQAYFEGRFAEAAAAYEALLNSGPAAAELYYNLGTAHYKAGQYGRAIAAYLQAQKLAPRDPNLRFNLKFVREQVTGSEGPFGPAWKRALAALTLNEWTLLAASLLWAWFILLILREARPVWRRALRPYIGLAAVGTLVAAGCLAAAWNQAQVPTAVVIQREAVVRQGPLERSPTAFKLRDGSEVLVQDRQEISDNGQRQIWVRVQDAGGRVGWVRSEEILRT